jgi:hypothetical protein
MALVHRNGKAYLYRSVRRGGRVTSEYVAGGESAVLIAALETIDRDKRDYERWHEREERRKIADLERSLDELAADARGLARAALETAGYHQHARGQWRKRRGTPG